MSQELHDKIRRINEGAPEELCPCGKALLFTKPFGQLCSDACMKRFCPKCRGPKIEVEDHYTDGQARMIQEAFDLRLQGAYIRKNARMHAYHERAEELRLPGQMKIPPSDVYAGLNGLCCRSRGIWGRNLDGRPWCTERPWCKQKFEAIHRASQERVGHEDADAMMRRADTLCLKADAVSAQVGPPPTIMVCEPCAAERKRANGRDYVHELIEKHAAKRRRVQ